MDPVSHAALFYLIGKKARVEKLWAGMVASVFPDAFLILFLWIGPLADLSMTSEFTDTVNLLMHSAFSLLFLLPIAIFSSRYFLASFAGYSVHLILDYLTHTTVRMPLFPLSTLKFPLFVAPYFNPIFLLLTNTAILGTILVFEGKRLASLFKGLIDSTRKKRLWLFAAIYAVTTALFSVSYTATAFGPASPVLFTSLLLIEINLLLVGVLFLVEVYMDENIRPRLRMMIRFLFGQANKDNRFTSP